MQDLKATYHIRLLIFLLVGKSFRKASKEQMKEANLKACASFAVEITLQLSAILLQIRK